MNIQLSQDENRRRWRKRSYLELDKKQREQFNLQRLEGILADYGYQCIRLSTDWNGADFLAQSFFDQSTLLVQLKAVLTISTRYVEKNIYMAFPLAESNDWILIPHDTLLEKVKLFCPSYLKTKSWSRGGYSTAKPPKKLISALQEYRLDSAMSESLAGRLSKNRKKQYHKRGIQKCLSTVE